MADSEDVTSDKGRVIYMLDTSFCAFIMRQHPEALLRHCCTINTSCCGVTVICGPPVGNAAQRLADALCGRLNAVLPRGRTALEATTETSAAWSRWSTELV